MSDVDPTLGERFDEGRVTPDEVEGFARKYGPDWRDVRVQDALKAVEERIADLAAGIAADEQQIAGFEERKRIAETLLKHQETTNRLVDDQMIASVIAELYGETPASYEVEAVLEVIENHRRILRGEEPITDLD